MEGARQVHVAAGSGTYDVWIGFELFAKIGPLLQKDGFKASSLVIITDDTVSRLHGVKVESLKGAVVSSGVCAKEKVLYYEVKGGEKTKTREVKTQVEDFLLQNQCDKKTVLVALGGGVIGDLVGFIAATYYRGIRFIQIPTTFLAMVDSSVGGKTAVNTPYGKNLIGAIKQPCYVFADLDFFSTLDDRNMANGMAEVIKSGLTSLPDLFVACEENAPSYREDKEFLLRVVFEAVKFKADVVMQDENDSGLRNILNFGHSIGHAVELLPANKWLHGECVSVGCVYELMAARALGRCSAELVQRAEKCFQSYKLPTMLNPPFIDVEGAMRNLAMDKKNRGGVIFLIIVEDTDGIVVLPGSKSIANRALLLAAIGEGPCVLENLPACEDIRVMLAALSGPLRVGASWQTGAAGSGVMANGHGGGGGPFESALKLKAPQPLSVPGMGLSGGGAGSSSLEGSLLGSEFVLKNGVLEVWVENAGTVARLLTPILCLFLLRGNKESFASVRVDGNKRMRVRPIKDLADCIEAALPCIQITYGAKEGCLPIEISRRAGHNASFPGGELRLNNKISSQFVSAMLMLAPLAESPVTLILNDMQKDAQGNLQAVSQPYIDMTVRMMEEWGASVKRVAPDRYVVPPGKHRNPPRYAVEADASAASYPLAWAAMTGGEVSVNMEVTENPLQGDAHFVDVLRELGCDVRRRPGWTTVKGVGQLGEGLVEKMTREGENAEPLRLDMSTMTDTFLTAAVLLARVSQTAYCSSSFPASKAVAEIVNVENQRVKECNRIGAMHDNLSRAGAVIEELQDGLRFFPSPPTSAECPQQSVVVECHSDHRIAMAMAIYAAVRGRLIIPEWRCVEKTFSDYWDVLASDLGVRFKGCGIEAETDPGGSSHGKRSLVLIGMRNSGKTRLGKEAAEVLSEGLREEGQKGEEEERSGWGFSDLDELFPFDIGTFVKEHGWAAFRKEESDLLKKTLLQKETGEESSGSSSASPVVPGGCRVVACGGGVVEAPGAMELLQKEVPTLGGSVVWVRLTDEDVITFNKEDKKKPAYGESIEEVFGRRKEKYREASSFEFVAPPFSSFKNNRNNFWAAVHRAFGNFSRAIALPPPPILRGSQFLSLTMKDLTQEKKISTMASDVDALEIRVDLLEESLQTGRELGLQVFHVRNQTSVPLLITYRSGKEGGKGVEEESRMLEVLRDAMRFGVEFIDVESRLSEDAKRSIAAMKPGNTKVVLSKHFLPPSEVPQADGVAGALLDLAAETAITPDVLKVVFSTDEDGAAGVTRIQAGVASVCEQNSLTGPTLRGKQIICMAMGRRGVLSRVLNEAFTPVTHRLLPTAAAPGQLEGSVVRDLRSDLSLPVKQFFVFGKPVGKSASPPLYNSLFRQKSFPGIYSRYETADPLDIRQLMRTSVFWGASVTIPLKEKVAALLDSVTPQAKKVGAVNTIWRTGDGKFHGTNTDLIAIEKGIRIHMEELPADGAETEQKSAKRSRTAKAKAKASPSSSVPKVVGNGLVLGAGGAARAACFACQRLGLRLFVWNRTGSKAETLSREFSGEPWECEEVPEGGFQAIIGTIPGTSLPPLKDDVFTKSGKKPPVVIEMAYLPKETKLTERAAEFGCPIVFGIDILIEQGLEQARLYTGEKISEDEIKIASADVYAFYEGVKESYYAEKGKTGGGEAKGAAKGAAAAAGASERDSMGDVKMGGQE
uniref:Pentafunctional AROM polypeptide n=1 Tax=Chromera velia CCMP2878 TaxID=1169474 RepID=A0A0G4G7D8_9ALVE|eukprot:Cvel_20600.t1-p1 / transcript=Cvel_20600.t1 / gene=Cvel_20600 / organism=Chromera_velia_CCMP2878 / gene_product=Pentafunctional AROM polypeptide, putative / transcript_product=Pentafunctional AROM polypeptide, putative / location=Cvel_scaffold1863:1522-20524(-) / protein_length=1698 / sequence_SO=supercontig / SO=protein_coding / is_pseudo=false